ncbi:alpha/beta fold hydrolase [Arthrobacter cavernae]|uniref:Alpha/beta fold hydrolase n=1 Tax=Arthrobacter cavernae TaxID=2817681 RepID=A0A939HEX9_9MICC|nr:alpha/beta hydrolase [Arthrobacter cavernae]MBO1269657.1 alpha/beta fold hydrolase [Arthrobacter cavernae]
MSNDAPPLHVEVREAAAPLAGSPPAVLIHGWASSSIYWEPLAQELLDAGHRVWILDLPGYHPGEELPGDFAWTLDSAAAAVAAAIAARTAEAVHVAGHSLGGSVALTLAAHHPERVATLALVGMVPAPPNQGFRTMLLSQLEQGFIDAGTRAKCMKAWFGPLPAEETKLLSRGFEVPFPVLAASGTAAMAGVAPEVPGLVKAPTLVLTGTADRLRTPEQVQEFVSGSPLRRLAAVPGAGHSVHWEQPRACAVALHEFWKESWPPPA